MIFNHLNWNPSKHFLVFFLFSTWLGIIFPIFELMSSMNNPVAFLELSISCRWDRQRSYGFQATLTAKHFLPSDCLKNHFNSYVSILSITVVSIFEKIAQRQRTPTTSCGISWETWLFQENNDFIAVTSIGPLIHWCICALVY